MGAHAYSMHFSANTSTGIGNTVNDRMSARGAYLKMIFVRGRLFGHEGRLFRFYGNMRPLYGGAYSSRGVY